MERHLFWEMKELKCLVSCQQSTPELAGDESLGTVPGLQYFWYSRVFLGVGCSQGESGLIPDGLLFGHLQSCPVNS